MADGDVFNPEKDKFYQFKPFRVPKYQIEFKNANKLADISGYVWYTPAMLYVWGRYSEKNLADIVQRHDVKIFWYRFDKPVFTGFTVGADSSWNHILWAASESHWPKLIDAILETVQFDIPNAKLYQYALQRLTILDPLLSDNQRVILSNHPTQLIHAFAVLSNDRQVAFDTRQSGVTNCPGVVSFKPNAIHVQAANRLFSINNLTQDRAFERYKEVLLQTQDTQYQEKINQQKGKK